MQLQRPYEAYLVCVSADLLVIHMHVAPQASSVQSCSYADKFNDLATIKVQEINE